MSMQNQRPPQMESHSRGSVALARLFWFFVGPMALGLIAVAIVSSGTGWTTGLDAAFLGVTVGMLLARWFELRSGEGRDGYGNLATLAAFPKYAGWVLLTALAVWTAANLLGNHLL